jgi:hypothetical protein
LSNQQRTNIRTQVKDQAGIPRSSSRRRTTFNTLGVLVFLLGTGSAGLIHWNVHHRSAQPSNVQGASAVDGSWQDGTLATQDSKKSSHDLELYYGKAGLLAVRLRDWFEQPESLAIILATISTLAALACFLLADW